MADAQSLTEPSDTIFALSSGRPPCAIAIVRTSGPRSYAVLEAMGGCASQPRHATRSTLRDRDGTVLDDALTLAFPAPHSATGEDVVEYHVHGGLATVDAVCRALAEHGLRLAHPGEFTRRALANGKLDGGDVIALADLLEAETDYQRRVALARARSRRGETISAWSDRLVTVAARIEASIEHDDDVEIGDPVAGVVDELAAIRTDIVEALGALPASRRRDGARIVIAGAVNAGKSSLFNALLGADAAIVSAHEGTTRDLVERPIDLGGYPAILIDSAGFRARPDEVEAIGIARARDAIADADITIDLGEAAINHPRRIAVSAKCDMGLAASSDRIAVSAFTGTGLNELKASLARELGKLFPVAERVVQDADRSILAIVSTLLAGLHERTPLVLIAEAVREARATLSKAGAAEGLEPVLDAVYSRFCLGK